MSPIPLDVHLMIDDADRWAPGYAELGAFSVTFHAEAADDPVALARRLRAIGARAGIALKPGTAVEPYLELLPEFDQVLVMTVEPGFGGQASWPRRCPSCARCARRSTRAGLDVWLQVDGGIALRHDRDRGRGGGRHVRRRVERLRRATIRMPRSRRCAPPRRTRIRVWLD